MSLNKILLFIFAFFILASDAHAILGLESRREQKRMIADAREAFTKEDYTLVIEITESFFLRTNAPKRRLKRMYLLRGESYKKLGAYDKALLTYGEAMAFFPNDVDLNLALADIYTTGGLSDKAIAVYKEVLELEPSNTDAKLALARAYLAEGFFVRAGMLFKEYTQSVENADSTVYYEYALSNFKANDYDTALSLVQKSIELAPSADAALLLACIYKAKGDTKTAFAAIKQAQSAFPERDDIFLTRALWLAYDDDFNEESYAMAREYLAKHPGNRLALFVEYLSLHRQGKEDRALKSLKALTLQEGSGLIDRFALGLYNGSTK